MFASIAYLIKDVRSTRKTSRRGLGGEFRLGDGPGVCRGQAGLFPTKVTENVPSIPGFAVTIHTKSSVARRIAKGCSVQQDAHGAVADIGNSHIWFTVPVEVGHDELPRIGSDRKLFGFLEGAIAIPQQNRHVAGAPGRNHCHGQVQVAIAVEVGRDDPMRVFPSKIALRRLQRSVAVPEQDMNLEGVAHSYVQVSVVVEVPQHHD
jgi:hypothetical protein